MTAQTEADKIAAALRPLGPGGKLAQEDVPLINQLGLLWANRLASVAVPGDSGFKLGTLSRSNLEGVKPELVSCVERAITFSTVDFRVQQGKRSIEEQRKAVAAGNSRTMHSKHLPQPDGTVWAVDLVVLTNGQVDWTFDRYAAIALAMDTAATQLGLANHIRWGCAWDRVLSDFGGSEAAYLAEASAYAKRHAGSDLLDAPHFEWVP